MLSWSKKRQRPWFSLILLVMMAFAILSVLLTVKSCKQGAARLNGTYVFEKKVYLLLTPKLVSDSYIEYYTFSDDMLVVTDASGTEKEYPIFFQKSEVDKEAFASEFSIEPGPDLSAYQSCYLLTDDEASYPYRIYAMDGEIWLANFDVLYITNTKGPTEKKIRINSIFQITPYAGALPGETAPLSEPQT